MEKLESKIQQEIVMYFNHNYCLNFHNPQCVIFSIPNEGLSKKETIQKMATGLLPGAADLMILMPKLAFYVEVKTPTGTQKENQKKFEKRVNSLGFNYYIVRSLEEFIIVIDNILLNNPL
jgi:hypothetical protein